MVVVVGVDLSDVSEHLMARARDLVSRVDDPELHIVHVMTGPLSWVSVGSTLPSAIAVTSHAEEARQDLQALCVAVLEGSRARVIVHTPVGRAADEITRIAREVGADVIVVEVHDRHRMRRGLHHSLVADIARSAPCSVLALRDPARAARAGGVSRPRESSERHA
jgi:nucleotide-binding universal stress UspA family protein